MASLTWQENLLRDLTNNDVPWDRPDLVSRAVDCAAVALETVVGEVELRQVNSIRSVPRRDDLVYGSKIRVLCEATLTNGMDVQVALALNVGGSMPGGCGIALHDGEFFVVTDLSPAVCAQAALWATWHLLDDGPSSTAATTPKRPLTMKWSKPPT